MRRALDHRLDLWMHRDTAKIGATHGEGEITGADEAAVEAFDAEHGRKILHSTRFFNQAKTHYLAIRNLDMLAGTLRIARIPGSDRIRGSTDSTRGIFASAHQGFSITRGIAVGENQPFGAGVKVLQNQPGIGPRHSNQGGYPDDLGRANQMPRHLGVDGGMFAVQDDIIEACVAAKLDQFRRPELLEQGAGAGPSCLELLT
jgi:hypothetical protein